MRFDSPIALLLLLFVPLFFRRVRGRAAGKSDSIAFSPPISVHSLPASTRSKLREPLLSVLGAASYCLLVLALARPQTGTEFTEVEASGRDIILSLDISGSMQALDFMLDGKRVDRLTALKAVVKKFIESRQGDRMGITVFGDHAFTQSPLTLDTIALKSYVDALEIGMSGKGTAIGDGIAIALKQIERIDSDSKVIILVTDGKSNSGKLQPAEAAKLASKLKVKVHTIGIGGEGYAPFPTETFFGRTAVVNRKLEFDEKTLRMIAEVTGGEYFYAKDTERLEQVYEEIDKLEERKEKTLEYVEYEERFMPFLILGMLLFFSEHLLTATVLLRVP